MLAPAGQGYLHAHAADRLINLEGEWKIMRGDDPRYADPAYDDDRWPSIRLPSKKLLPADTAYLLKSGADAAHSRKGYVWFRKKIIVSDPPAGKMLVQIREIVNADRIYLNGTSVGGSGRFPPEFRSAWAKFRSYHAPGVLFRKGENLMAIRVYFDSEAWIMAPMRIVDYRSGSISALVHDFFLNYAIQALSFFLFGLSFFFMFLFLHRKKDTVYLFFSICSMVLAASLMLHYFENFYPDIPISSNNVLKITQSGLLLFPAFLALFYRSYSGEGVSIKRIILYNALPLAGCVLMDFSDERWDILYWRNIFLLIIPIYIIDVFILSTRQLLRRNRQGLFMFIGLLPILLLAFHDISAFALNLIDSSIALYVYGIPLMIVIFGIHLTEKFVSSLDQAENLNRELTVMLEENRRLSYLEHQIAMAREIQLANVPKVLPRMSCFDIAVTYEPMQSIGGDFYDFHVPNEYSIGNLVTDVSGHGMPAALISSMVKVIFKMLRHLADQPRELLEEMSRTLAGNIEDHFLTAEYIFIDHREKKFRYCRAGHEPLLVLKRGERKLVEYQPRGHAIGWKRECVLELCEADIEEGDRIILYTDCITEAFNEKREMFGEQSFREFIIENGDLTAAEFSKSLYNKLRSWIGGDHFDDDFTLVVIDVK